MDGTNAARTDLSAEGVTRIALRGRRMVRLAGRRSQAGAGDSGCVLPAFVAGPENQLLSQVLGPLVQTSPEGPFAAVADPCGPITLVGPSGCGKTHLAHGLAELWHQSFGAAAANKTSTTGAEADKKRRGVAYLTASDFSRQIADAIEDGAVAEMRRQLRGCGLLVLDDLDRISSAQHVQEELLHTIDALSEAGGMMVFAAAALPADTAALSRALVSRLSQGVVLEIAPLGVEARGELLRQIGETLGYQFDKEALATLAEHLPGEPPKLLSAGVELRQRFGAHVDSGDAERFLNRDQDNSPPFATILATVARYYGVNRKVLTSASRRQTVVLARAVAIYLARRLTPLSYQEIGRSVGGRDHTTILHNFRRIEKALPKDRALRSAVEDLERSLTSVTA